MKKKKTVKLRECGNCGAKPCVWKTPGDNWQVCCFNCVGAIVGPLLPALVRSWNTRPKRKMYTVEVE